MPAEKIAITLDRNLVKEIDRNVKSGLFKNRSRAIEEAMRDKLERHRRGRLLTEARKLDPKEERALAEEGPRGASTERRGLLGRSQSRKRAGAGRARACSRDQP